MRCYVTNSRILADLLRHVKLTWIYAFVSKAFVVGFQVSIKGSAFKEPKQDIKVIN